MQTLHLIFLIVISLIYLAWSVFIINKIFKPNHFTKTQKCVHIILVILIPIVWGVILLSILKPSYKGTSSPEYRINKQKTKYENNHNGVF